MDRLPEHDPAVEEELFARLTAEMQPFLDKTSRRDHIAVAVRLVLVVAGLVAVIAGLSRSVLISAAGYTVALFALVSLAAHVGPAWGRARRVGRALRQRLR